jgi:hypothetical protein
VQQAQANPQQVLASGGQPGGMSAGGNVLPPPPGGAASMPSAVPQMMAQAQSLSRQLNEVGPPALDGASLLTAKKAKDITDQVTGQVADNPSKVGDLIDSAMQEIDNAAVDAFNPAYKTFRKMRKEQQATADKLQTMLDNHLEAMGNLVQPSEAQSQADHLVDAANAARGTGTAGHIADFLRHIPTPQGMVMQPIQTLDRYNPAYQQYQQRARQAQIQYAVMGEELRRRDMITNRLNDAVKQAREQEQAAGNAMLDAQTRRFSAAASNKTAFLYGVQNTLNASAMINESQKIALNTQLQLRQQDINAQYMKGMISITANDKQWQDFFKGKELDVKEQQIANEATKLALEQDRARMDALSKNQDQQTKALAAIGTLVNNLASAQQKGFQTPEVQNILNSLKGTVTQNAK